MSDYGGADQFVVVMKLRNGSGAKGLALSVWTLVTTQKEEEDRCSNKRRNV
jgi:hypothetical protein